MTPPPVGQFFVVPCVIHHITFDGPPDEYGSPTPTETATNTRCYLAQMARNEIGIPMVETERWTGFFPPDIDLDATDTVEADGNTFQVTGNPWRVVDPVTATVSHIEATLEQTR